jgi:hypothetical protein
VSKGLLIRKTAFWTSVVGAIVLTNFGLELLADNVPSGAFKQFVAYIHRGPGGAA